MKVYIVFCCIFAAVCSWGEELSIVDILVERGLRSEESAILDAAPIIDADGARELVETVMVTKYPSFSIAPSMHLFSTNIKSGAIGYFDTFSPIQLHYRWRQLALILWKKDNVNDKWIGNVHRFEIGTSLGLIVQAATINHDFNGHIGFCISPLTVSYKNFAIGLGMRYITSDKFDLTNPRHWSFGIPFSYQFTFGKEKEFNIKKIRSQNETETD